MSRYYLNRSGESEGPFDPTELAPLLDDNYYVCAEGGTEWVFAADVPELAASVPVKYYAFVNGESVGPYTADEVKAIYAPDLQVCPVTGGDWIPASQVSGLAPSAPAAPPQPAAPPKAAAPVPPGAPTAAKDDNASAVDAPPDDLPPKLQELWRVSRNAPDELLIQQKKKHWKKYYKNERVVILAELDRRGLK